MSIDVLIAVLRLTEELQLKASTPGWWKLNPSAYDYPDRRPIVLLFVRVVPTDRQSRHPTMVCIPINETAGTDRLLRQLSES